MLNQAKLWYFQGKDYLSHPKEWTQERELVNCKTCFEDCEFRNRKERFPADIGGACQCIRHAKEMNKYSFRNGNGLVISIPQDVIRQIVSDVVQELKT